MYDPLSKWVTCSQKDYIFSVLTDDPLFEQIIYSLYELPTPYRLFTSERTICSPYI